MGNSIEFELHPGTIHTENKNEKSLFTMINNTNEEIGNHTIIGTCELEVKNTKTRFVWESKKADSLTLESTYVF